MFLLVTIVCVEYLMIEVHVSYQILIHNLTYRLWRKKLRKAICLWSPFGNLGLQTFIFNLSTRRSSYFEDVHDSLLRSLLLKIAIYPCYSRLQYTPITQDCNLHMLLKIAIYPSYSRLQYTPVTQDCNLPMLLKIAIYTCYSRL